MILYKALERVWQNLDDSKANEQIFWMPAFLILHHSMRVYRIARVIGLQIMIWNFALNNLRLDGDKMS